MVATSGQDAQTVHLLNTRRFLLAFGAILAFLHTRTKPEATSRKKHYPDYGTICDHIVILKSHIQAYADLLLKFNHNYYSMEQEPDYRHHVNGSPPCLMRFFTAARRVGQTRTASENVIFCAQSNHSRLCGWRLFSVLRLVLSYELLLLFGMAFKAL